MSLFRRVGSTVASLENQLGTQMYLAMAINSNSSPTAAANLYMEIS